LFDASHHQILDQCRNNLFGYAFALTRDAEQAADLFHDCVVRAMSNPGPPQDARSFRAWLFTILRNLWIDQLRAQIRTREMKGEIEAAEVADASRFPENVVVNRIAVRQAFARLSKDHRDVLALVDIGGFSYEETAKMLDVPKGTIMSRVSRARLVLAQLLSDSQVETLTSARRRSAND